jgi:hypothetical protein
MNIVIQLLLVGKPGKHQTGRGVKRLNRGAVFSDVSQNQRPDSYAFLHLVLEGMTALMKKMQW